MTVERFFIDEAKKAHDIEAFLREELDVAGFSHADVKRTPLGTRIIIHALRPGLVIGGGGSNIKRLTNYVDSKFNVENPHLEVEQIKEAYLDPHIVAWRIARSLEKGAYFKRVANITMQRVEQSGAKGVEIRLGGKLPSSRAKTWIFTSGKLRKCGQEAIDQVQSAYARSMTKPGVVGVKVSILPPEATFSDAITEKNIPQEVEVKKDRKPLVVPKDTKPPSKEVEDVVEKEIVESTDEDKILSKVGDKDSVKIVETEEVEVKTEAPVEEPVKKTTKEKVETPAEEVTKKATKAVKEPTKEVTKEVTKPAEVAAKKIKETKTEEVTKEKPTKTPVKAVAKEVTKETTKETTKKPTEDKDKEVVGKKVSKETSS